MAKGAGLFSESQQDALVALAKFCASLSFVASVFIILSFLRFQELRKLRFVLVTLLAASDLAADITYFFGAPPDGSPLCTAQGSLQQYFQMAEVLWIAAITHVLYVTATNPATILSRTRRSMVSRYQMYVWSTALFFMFLPFLTQSYGSSGIWCWIRVTDDKELDWGTVWRYLAFYIPLWIVIAMVVGTTVIVWRVMRAMTDHASAADLSGLEQTKRIRHFIRSLAWYPIVLVVCWTVPTINRIHNSVNPSEPVFGLYVVQTITVRLQGLLFALLFALSRTVQQKWAGLPCVKRVLGRRGEGGMPYSEDVWDANVSDDGDYDVGYDSVNDESGQQQVEVELWSDVQK